MEGGYQDYWVAYPEGPDEGLWERGATPGEAVGNWFRSYGEKYGVEVSLEWDPAYVAGGTR